MQRELDGKVWCCLSPLYNSPITTISKKQQKQAVGQMKKKIQTFKKAPFQGGNISEHLSRGRNTYSMWNRGS